MKVKELIERLQELENEIGNVDVDLIIEDIDGIQTGFQEINEVDISINVDDDTDKAIYIGYFNRNGKNYIEE